MADPAPTTLPPLPATMVVWHAFTAEGEYELTVAQGDEVRALRAVDDDWMEAEFAGRIGILPISYLELPSAAATAATNDDDAAAATAASTTAAAAAASDAGDAATATSNDSDPPSATPAATATPAPAKVAAPSAAPSTASAVTPPSPKTAAQGATAPKANTKPAVNSVNKPALKTTNGSAQRTGQKPAVNAATKPAATGARTSITSASPTSRTAPATLNKQPAATTESSSATDSAVVVTNGTSTKTPASSTAAPAPNGTPAASAPAAAAAAAAALVPARSAPAIPTHRAVDDFTAELDTEVTFAVGDLLVVTSMVDENWLLGFLAKDPAQRLGIFPNTYVEQLGQPATPTAPQSVDQPLKTPATNNEVVSDAHAPAAPASIISSDTSDRLTSALGVASALEDFESEDAAELTVRKSDLVTVLCRIDENWFECLLNGRVGIVPVASLSDPDPAKLPGRVASMASQAVGGAVGADAKPKTRSAPSRALPQSATPAQQRPAAAAAVARPAGAAANRQSIVRTNGAPNSPGAAATTPRASAAVVRKPSSVVSSPAAASPSASSSGVFGLFSSGSSSSSSDKKKKPRPVITVVSAAPMDPNAKPFEHATTPTAAAAAAPPTTTAPPTAAPAASPAAPAAATPPSAPGRPAAAPSRPPAAVARPVVTAAKPSPIRSSLPTVKTNGAPARAPNPPRSASLPTPAPIVAVVDPTPAALPESPKTPVDKREMILRELVATEESYIADLNMIYTSYVLPMSEAELPGIDLDTLFGNVVEVADVNERLLGMLKVQQSLVDPTQMRIGECFVDVGKDFKSVYGIFCRNHDDSAALTIALEQDPTSPAGQLLKQCHDQLRLKSTGLCDLSSLLIKPIQRILKYPLLLTELVKATSPSHPDADSIQRAVTLTKEIAADINELKRRKDLVQKYISPNRRQTVYNPPRKAAAAETEDSEQDAVAGPTLAPAFDPGRGKIERLNWHSISKKTTRMKQGILQFTGQASQTIDEKFVLEEKRFKRLQKSVQSLLRCIQSHVQACKDASTAQTTVSQHIKEFYWTDSFQRAEINMYQHAHLMIDREALDFYLRMLQRRVIAPLEVLLSHFQNPASLIQKRYHKLLDFDNSTSKMRSMKDIEVTESIVTAHNFTKNTYLALNDQLLEELPRFWKLAQSLLHTVISTLISSHDQYYSKTVELLLPMYSSSLLRQDQEIIRGFFERQAPSIKRMLALPVVPAYFTRTFEMAFRKNGAMMDLTPDPSAFRRQELIKGVEEAWVSIADDETARAGMQSLLDVYNAQPGFSDVKSNAELKRKIGILNGQITKSRFQLRRLQNELSQMAASAPENIDGFLIEQPSQEQLTISRANRKSVMLSDAPTTPIGLSTGSAQLQQKQPARMAPATSMESISSFDSVSIDPAASTTPSHATHDEAEPSNDHTVEPQSQAQDEHVVPVEHPEETTYVAGDDGAAAFEASSETAYVATETAVVLGAQYRAMYSFQSDVANNISYDEGELFELIQDCDDQGNRDWWRVRRLLNNEEGFVAHNYIELLPVENGHVAEAGDHTHDPGHIDEPAAETEANHHVEDPVDNIPAEPVAEVEQTA
ncbi:hypothetical protein CAOG_00292 [Capsaspora owczarzaki ATCC 30864]|uniref:Dynamin-binding protein n=1 Tax=Capsaspora owczarzaki (strain ATCC 30864) TaxID=595528 RepID=A0A0D2U0E5_CAPO3|nr:hypothetical protein CAOG_00292 [Capsaspora owczarzaki ATCC 30864]KJE88686.1 hypothetical protein CAOG_000292 [Capsaspora owczarzaki ATCC 30864]|eukprot:XP_004365163.1 hypothetical protein CAOG_00292 [Capsaspora owczarzaki ATCC 30864]